MSTRRKLIVIALIAGLLAWLGGDIAGAKAFGHGHGSGPPTPRAICGLQDRMDQQAPSGTWVISRANAFDTSGQRLCVKAGPRPGFKILTSLRFTGAWQAYPFTGVGCAYYLCSPGTDLPKKVWRLPRDINSSFSWWGPSPGGNWNASYDIWFDKHNQISTEDNGAELMIWLRSNPGYSGGQWVYVPGVGHFLFRSWRTCDHVGICWNYIQFRYPNGIHSVKHLPLMPFIRWCVTHGHLIRWRWWLTSIHAGYELVAGGKGLATTYFDART